MYDDTGTENNNYWLKKKLQGIDNQIEELKDGKKTIREARFVGLSN